MIAFYQKIKSNLNLIIIALVLIVFTVLSLTGSLGRSNTVLLEKIAIATILATSLARKRMESPDTFL